MNLLRRRKADPNTLASFHQPLPHLDRVLTTLTTKTQQCIDRIDEIERRIDELGENLANGPSHGDVLEVRIHSAKLAAELARATVELRGEIGMASDEARRAARLARSSESEEVPITLPVDLDLVKRKNWSASA